MSGTTTPLYNQDFVRSTIELTLEFLSDIAFSIKVFSENIEKNEIQRNVLAKRLTQDISRFVELTTLLSKRVVISHPHILKEIKDSHIHLLFIMKGMISTQLKNDNLALEELIKYELKDNLTQWKIHLIPKIKAVLNN